MNYIKTLFPACTTNGKETMYYVTHREHALKKLDLRNLEVSYMDNPQNYIPTEWTGVDKLIVNNDNLYLFEQNGKRVLEYSLSKNISRVFDLKYGMYDSDNWSICTILNGIMYVFPSFANKVIKINLKNGAIDDKKELYPNIMYVFKQKNNCFISKGKKIEIPYKLYSCGCQLNDDIWIFSERKGFALKYSLLTEKCTKYAFPIKINGCIYSIWREGLFYILSIEGNLYSWNIVNSKVEILFDSQGKYPYPYFGKIAVTNTNIWILPFFGEDIYIVDLMTGDNIIYAAYPSDFYYDDDPNRSKYYSYAEDTENYYFSMHCANYILSIEKKTGKEHWLKPIEPDLHEKIKYYSTLDIKEYEEADFGLNGFFSLLDQGKSNLEKIKQGTNGKDIWSRLIK